MKIMGFQITRFGFFVLISSLATSCMTIQPANSLAETLAIMHDGALPAVDTKTAEDIIATSEVPVAIMLSAEWCKICSAFKPSFWRATRKSEGKFIGAVLDVDRNESFWEKYGKPGLPTIIIFEKGKKRWLGLGYPRVENMVVALVTNHDGFIHGLSARTNENLPKKARVFLVAANATSAAFAQEVIDQVEYWKNSGLSDDEIACYWSVPNFEQYLGDKEQFKKLGPLLSRCYRANIDTLESHWKQAAAVHPKSMFLYISSHGMGEDQAQAVAKAVQAIMKKEQRVMGDACKTMGHAQLVFDSVAGEAEALDFSEVYEQACDENAKHASAFTSQRLHAFLTAVSEPTRKTIVLQGCHAGAIIPQSLPPHAVILAASSPHRSSFGCNADGDRTVYGEELLAAMNRLKPRQGHLADWVKVHDEVSREVDQREQKLNIPADQRSIPMILSGASD